MIILYSELQLILKKNVIPSFAELFVRWPLGSLSDACWSVEVLLFDLFDELCRDREPVEMKTMNNVKISYEDIESV